MSIRELKRILKRSYLKFNTKFLGRIFYGNKCENNFYLRPISGIFLFNSCAMYFSFKLIINNELGYLNKLLVLGNM